MEIQSAYTAQGFCRMTSVAKMGLICEVLSLGAWRLWGWGKLLCVPHVQKKCKIVSYIKKYLLSHIRAPFLFWRKVTCSHIFCAETCMILRTVFITECKVQCCLEYLPFSSAKNIEWFTYYVMLKIYLFGFFTPRSYIIEWNYAHRRSCLLVTPCQAPIDLMRQVLLGPVPSNMTDV